MAFVLLVVGALAPPPARAAGHGEPGPVFPVEILLRDRGADLKALGEMRIDVDAVFRDRARAFVVAEEMEKLLSLGFDVERAPVDTPRSTRGT
jgi:hypothetical protein